MYDIEPTTAHLEDYKSVGEDGSFMIEGHVAAIVDNNYYVVMDKGYNNGIKKNMNFILFEYGDDIKDPTTGEVLDKEIKVKYPLRVYHVQEKMTTLYSIGRVFGFGPVRMKFKGVKIGDPIRRNL